MDSILDKWKEENGLITTVLASMICNKAESTISRAVDSGKIKSYTIGKTRYLSMKDVLFYKAQSESNGTICTR